MIPTPLGLIHLIAETILAGLLWILYRRLIAWQKRLEALENEQALSRKRNEAATAGLHIRLLAVERHARQAAAAPGPIRVLAVSKPAAAAAAPPRRDGAAPQPEPGPAAPLSQLSRGERDLLAKLRQLRRR